MKEAGHSIAETESVTPWSRKLYRNAEEFWNESDGLHYAYLIYRTLRGDYDQFKPDAVFYVGKSPAAYLKKVDGPKIPEDDIRVWQRFLWHHTVVPMLIVGSKTQVQVYTAYTPPKEKDRITPILEAAADALKLDQLLTAIEAGTIYEEKPEAFYKLHAVDRYLLDQLNVAAVQLAETQEGGVGDEGNLKFVHQFLTRLLFVCYLIERGMIKGEHFDDEALKKLHPNTEKQKGYFLYHLFDDLGACDDLDAYPKKLNVLCRLFARIKERFNGSLFPENGVKDEKGRYNKEFISILHRFLKAQELKRGQLILDFWAYDFSVIPIETISAVYESFLGTQGKIRESLGEDDTKRTAGAYYTPLHLAELTVDIALENNKKPIHELKVLDPACGSGVFLVSLFGRMVESLRRQENHIEKRRSIGWARKLLPMLGQLYGIDISSTACHITCFSLYLALLEQVEPKHVEYLCDHGEKLPPLLSNTVKNSLNTILHGNLFDPKLSLKENDFDIIIGNPPWVSRERQQDKHFKSWMKANPSKPCPGKQIANGFMWKTVDFLSSAGRSCLLLTAKVLFNEKANEFQKEWFNAVNVEQIINFSDLRFVLFAEAIHPCVAICFQPPQDKRLDFIEYKVPKVDIRSKQGGPVYIREEDSIHLRLKDILSATINDKATQEWKIPVWGSWRDRRLLSRLATYPELEELAGKLEEDKRWVKGQGCQPYSETDRSHKRKIYYPWWDSTYKFLSAKNDLDLVMVSSDGTEIPSEFLELRRSPDSIIFLHPKIILNHDASKVAFSNDPIIFRHTFQSIACRNLEDRDTLKFLSLVIKSDVIQYYLFHTSGSMAIERDSVLFSELLSLPFFLPEKAHDPKKAKDIVADAASMVNDFEKKLKTKEWFGEEEKRRCEVKKIRSAVEPLIREYYDIDKYEAMLIDDTRDYARRSFHSGHNTISVPTLREAKQKDQVVYAETLCEMLNHFGKGSSFKVNGEVIQGNPYSVVQVSLVDKIRKSIPVVKSNERLAQIFNRMEPLLEEKQGRFVFCKNLKVFDGNDLYILKPMQMRFWTRTAALNDADEVAGALLDSRSTK